MLLSIQNNLVKLMTRDDNDLPSFILVFQLSLEEILNNSTKRQQVSIFPKIPFENLSVGLETNFTWLGWSWNENVWEPLVLFIVIKFLKSSKLI